MENKDDWRKAIRGLELDNLQKEVNDIADKFNLKISETSKTSETPETGKCEENARAPLTPDGSKKIRNYINMEQYTPLTNCQTCQELHMEYDLELFTRPEDRIDLESESEIESEKQTNHQEEQYQNLFREIEDLELSQNENGPMNESSNQEQNEIEVINLEGIIEQEILELLAEDPDEEQEILELPDEEQEILELLAEEQEIIELPAEEPEIIEIPIQEPTENDEETTNEEIEELLTRQESTDERRLREFKKINKYYIRKLSVDPEFQTSNFRRMIYSDENGRLRYQEEMYGPPKPNNQMLKQLFEKKESGFQVRVPDLEAFLKKFSDRLYRFINEYQQIKEPFLKCNLENIEKNRKVLLACIYAGYHSIYNKNQTTIAPTFPKEIEDFNYRYWTPYQENFLIYVPQAIRYQFLLENQFDPYRRPKRCHNNEGEGGEEPLTKRFKKTPN